MTEREALLKKTLALAWSKSKRREAMGNVMQAFMCSVKEAHGISREDAAQWSIAHPGKICKYTFMLDEQAISTEWFLCYDGRAESSVYAGELSPDAEQRCIAELTRRAVHGPDTIPLAVIDRIRARLGREIEITEGQAEAYRKGKDYRAMSLSNAAIRAWKYALQIITEEANRG